MSTADFEILQDVRNHVEALSNYLNKLSTEDSEQISDKAKRFLKSHDCDANVLSALVGVMEMLSPRMPLSESIIFVSFEWRTPLIALNGYAEIFLSGSLGPLTEKQQLCVTQFQTEAAMLLAWANDLIMGTGAEQELKE